MFGVKVDFPDLVKVEAAALDEAASGVTEAMREATVKLKTALRSQVEEAGMGRRLANTWRGQAYPKSGNSLEPAGYVWSKAPRIIDAFARGSTIRPVNGAKFLWIPTKNVPRKARGRKMSPDEVDSYFNAEFEIVPSRKRGVYLALIPVISARSTRRPGYRQATKGRLAQGRKQKLVHMFTLVPSVKMPKRFELESAATEAAAYFAARMNG